MTHVDDLLALRRHVVAVITKCSDCGIKQRYCTICTDPECTTQRINGHQRLLWYCWKCIERHHVFHELAGTVCASRAMDQRWAKAEAYHEGTNETNPTQE